MKLAVSAKGLAVTAKSLALFANSLAVKAKDLLGPEQMMLCRYFSKVTLRFFEAL